MLTALSIFLAVALRQNIHSCRNSVPPNGPRISEVNWFRSNLSRHYLPSLLSGAVEIHSMADTQRIIVSLTRSSGNPPTYGLEGMFERAAMAAQAYARLDGDDGVVKVAIPRIAVSSRARMFDETGTITTNNGEAIQDLWSVLNAARDGRRVDILAVGIDGFSTCLKNFEAILKHWPKLDIWYVVAVGSAFKGSETAFPIAGNGIRYGKFKVAELVTTLKAPQNQRTDPIIKELIEICEKVNQGKEELQHRHYLNDYTIGRANFRIHPDTENADGVRPELRRKRILLEE